MLNSGQQVDNQEPRRLRQGTFRQRILWRVPDRKRYQGGHHNRRQQIQPQQLLVRIRERYGNEPG